MDIYLFNYTGDDRVVHKPISIAGADISMVNGMLRDASEFITPSFTMVTDPTGMNYCYIPAFERYYYITSITVVRTGLWAIECRVDVLKTYEGSILQCDIMVTRCSKDGSVANNDIGNNGLIRDNAVPLLTTNMHRQIKMGYLGVPINGEYQMCPYPYLVTVG